MKNYFSSNLKYLREKKKISKNKLGEMVGVNQTTLGRWENNELTPSIDNVIDVLNAFKLPISELGTFLGKDLKTGTSYEPTQDDLKNVLKEKGLIDENDEISDEDFNKLIAFAMANKDFIIKKEEP